MLARPHNRTCSKLTARSVGSAYLLALLLSSLFISVSSVSIPTPAYAAVTPVIQQLSRYNGTAGTTVWVFGKYFNKNQSESVTIGSTPTGLTVSWSCVSSTPVGSVNGSCAFIVSSDAAGGLYTVTLTSKVSGGGSAFATFRVLPAITLDVMSGSPPVGGTPGAAATVVTVTGTGFLAADTGTPACWITTSAPPGYTLLIDTSGQPPCTVSSKGRLSAKFKVGAGSTYRPNGYNITVTGNPGLDFASLRTGNFTVSPQIVLSAPSGPAGATISVFGSGFNSTISLCGIEGTPVDTGYTCDHATDGTVVGQFKVKSGVLTGSYFITVNNTKSPGSGRPPSAFTPFVVSGGPVVTLTPSPVGFTGTTVTVAGSNFNAADTEVRFNVTSLSGLPLVRTCTISGGSITGTCQFIVKPNALGRLYDIIFNGTHLGTTIDNATAQFLVQSKITLTPDNGGVATYVGISGSGFKAPATQPYCNKTITAFLPLFKGNMVTCTIDSDGVLTGNFTVMTGAFPGAHTITASNTTLVVQGSVSAVFTVKAPVITLSPSTRSGGQLVDVTGSGFSTGDTACTITGPTNVISGLPSCSVSGGNVVGSFTVGTTDNKAGIYTINVKGNVFDNANASLTVIPQIALAPSTTTVGSSVSISGSNFNLTGSCTIKSAPTNIVLLLSGDGCSIDSHYMVTPGSKFTVAANATGTYTITVYDYSLPTNQTASAELTIVARLVTLSPSYGPVGASVHVSGSGFRPTDTNCTITGTPVASGSNCTIAGGVVSGSFNVKSGTPPGNYTILVMGGPATPKDNGTATFRVDPGITLIPSSGGTGTNVLVTGSNFAAGDTGCTITSSPSGLISNPVCAISATAMSGSFLVAPGTHDDYTVLVTGTTGDQGRATFHAPPAPTLELDPVTGEAGTPVNASGSNYLGTTCLLTSSPSGLFTSSSCSLSGGELTGSFAVASGAFAGTVYTITAASNLGESATATFAVVTGPVGTLTLTPTLGPRGTPVVGTASGFATDTACILTSSPAGILSSPSCTMTGAGNVNVGFTVAATAVPGTYTILAVGNTGKSAAGDFEVTAPPLTMTLNPTSGPVGTAVTVSGSGYAGLTCALSSTPSGLFTSATCSISGVTLSGGFTVASGATGGYTVTVETDIAESKTATFTVTAGPVPTFTLSPTSGSGGTVVTASGENYEGASCSLSSTPSGLFTSSSCSITGGSLSGGFIVASAATIGSYTVRVETDVDEVLTRTFTVTAGPTFTLSVDEGLPGTVVSGSGVGYAGTSCALSSMPSGLLSSPSCSISAGTLTAGFTVASGAVAGSYIVTVTTNVAADTRSATFAVTSPGPTLTLSPASGRAGTAVVASGSNFVGTTCTLSASPSNLFTSSSCSIAAGTLTGGFTVASGATAGSYTVTVTTNVAGETRSVTFTVTGLRPCIIATATFGSEVSSAVQFLRSFRDSLVLSTAAGSAFMDVFNAWYYSFSPSVAGLIAGNDPLRATVRVILYPLLGILGISAFTYSTFSWAPEFAVVMAGLVASSLIGLVYLTPFAFVSLRALARRKRIKVTDVAKGSLLLLAAALALLAAGEVAGSFLLLAVASSAVVLICLISAPTIAALAIARPKPE